MATSRETPLCAWTDPDAQRTDLPPGVSTDDLVEAYRLQVLARELDRKAIAMSHGGRIGTYAPLTGQEAAQVGAAMALEERDYCFPTYRDHALYLGRGLEPADVLRHLVGRGNYVDRLDPDAVRTFTPSIPIATHLPHAVGVGMAADYRDDPVCALASFGDGATSEGDFHEACNFAGVFDAPVVFFCQNNGYAISTPTDRQTASATFAQKAHAYGFDGVRIDGNDVLAVYEAVQHALERARAGEGPTLVEAVTYRRGAHTTTDDPGRYRSSEEREDWPDPLAVTREYVERIAGWSDADEREAREWASDRVAAGVEQVEAEAPDPPESMMAHAYAEPTDRLRQQREELPQNPRRRH